MFDETVTGLDPETVYTFKLKAVNDLETPVDSDIVEGTFTTGGTGVGGTGGSRFRIGNDYVHTFVIDPATKNNEFTFTPPSYATSVRALVVAGGNNYSGKQSGVSGGSGGGIGGWTESDSVGSGIPGQGNAGGGCGGNGGSNTGGGGGGAGRVGSSGSKDSPPSGGSGGQGILSDISGVATWYAGGGGGGGAQKGTASNMGAPGSGGDGGGGQGGMAVLSGAVNPSFSQVAAAGVDGLGGGGGGGSDVSGYYQGANGGSGIVILRYTVQGTGAGSNEPVVTFQGVQYNGDLVISGGYRVPWAGEGATCADVYVKWGYTPNALTHQVKIADDVVGTGTFAFNIPVDQTTIYLQLMAKNGEYEGFSDRVLSVYVPEYDGDVPGDNSIPKLSTLTLSPDGIYAKVSGTVTSFGEAADGEEEIDGCVVYAYIGLTDDIAQMTKGAELSVTAGEAFSYNIVNLTPGTTYYWYFEAKNSAGQVVATAVDSFKTLADSQISTIATAVNQRTITLSGSVAVVGAGATYLMVRWNDGVWGEWQTVGIDSDSSSTPSFTTSYDAAGWDADISWEIMVSNSCVTAAGVAAEPVWTHIESGKNKPVDTAKYTWQAVDGKWDGEWNDPEHWSCNKDDNAGHPRYLTAIASFANCTLANPVSVTVNEQYDVKSVSLPNSAVDLSFVGTGSETSSLTLNENLSTELKSQSRLTFKDLHLDASGKELQFAKAENNRPTDVGLTFSGATVSANMLWFRADESSLTVKDRSVIKLTDKISLGGVNTTFTNDTSTISSENVYGPDNVESTGLKLVFSGESPSLNVTGDFQAYKRSDELRFSFVVPRGGYRQALIQKSGTAFGADLDSPQGDISKFVLEVAPDSPAFRGTDADKIKNCVIVNSAGGFNFDKLDISAKAKYNGEVECGAFKWGLDRSPLAEGAEQSSARQILLDLTPCVKPIGVMFMVR